jgi:hypothetical protein
VVNNRVSRAERIALSFLFGLGRIVMAQYRRQVRIGGVCVTALLLHQGIDRARTFAASLYALIGGEDESARTIQSGDVGLTSKETKRA